MASKSTTKKEGTNLKEEDKTSENAKTTLAIQGQLTMNNTPVAMEVNIDLLDYHKKNAEALHRLVEMDEFPTMRETRRKEHLGEKTTRQNRFWRHTLGHITHGANHLAITQSSGPWSLVQEFVTYTRGEQKNEEPEQKVLTVPDGDDLTYHTGVALATFNGVPVELCFWTDSDGDANIRAYVASENKSILSEIFDAFEEAAYEYLKGRVMDGHFTLLSRATTSSTDVILEPSVTDAIQRHVLDYRAHMPAIEAAGEDPSRGIILAGPPGTGKTSINRWILSALPDVTAVVVSSTTLQGDGLRTIMKLVKRTNGLLILEDLDAVGGVSREIADHPILSQLLELLDGLEGAGQVQVVATTNHLEKLDPALTARPGRFDRIINVGPPNAEARRELLRRALVRFSPGCGLNLDKAVARTQGFTGAYIAELGKSAFIESLQDGCETIGAKHLDAALTDVLNQFGRAINGHRDHGIPNPASSYGGVA